MLQAENGDKQPNFGSNYKQRTKGAYIEEALEQTKFGIFNYTLIFISGTIIAASSYETYSVSYVLPVSQCDLNLTIQQKGFLTSISFIGITCGSHLWGFLADTKGRKRVIQPTLITAFVLSVLSSFAGSFEILTLLRFLNGFFMAGSSATIFAYIGEFHTMAHRARVILTASVIYTIYTIFIPTFAWLVINQDWYFDIPYLGITYKPWRLLLVTSSLPGLAAAIALFFFPESPKFLLSQEDQNRAMNAIATVHRWNNGKNAKLAFSELLEEFESVEIRKQILENRKSRFPLVKSIWSQTMPLFQSAYLRPTLLICAIQFFAYATASGFFMFFPEISNRMARNVDSFTEPSSLMCDIINMDVTNVSGNSTTDDTCVTKLELETLEQGVILESAFSLGFLIIVILINKVGKFWILLAVFGVTGASGLLGMSSTIPLIQIICFSSLMCSGLGINVVNAATVELYPTSLRAMAMCVSQMFGRLGSFAGSSVAALLLDDHCESAFYISGTSIIDNSMAVFSIVCAILSFFIPNIHQRVTKKHATPVPRLSVLSLRF